MFKVGDRVERIKSFGVLKKGIYTVIQVRPEKIGAELTLEDNRNYDMCYFKLIDNLPTLIESANKGLEALSILVKDHRTNTSLYYAHPQGREQTIKEAFPVGMDSPARVFLKVDPKFVYNNTEYTLEEASKLSTELQEFFMKVRGA